MQGNFRPTCVMNALTILSKTPLYTKANISIKKDWEILINDQVEHNQMDSKSQIQVDDSSYDLDEEPISESLIHWFNDPHSIKYLNTTIIDIVPSEGFKPLGIFQDVYLEEMNFPTLFLWLCMTRRHE